MVKRAAVDGDQAVYIGDFEFFFFCEERRKDENSEREEVGVGKQIVLGRKET
jgi:hypothetical protein